VAFSVRGLGYIFLAFFAGIGLRRDDKRLPVALAGAAALAIIGVYYDYLFTVPWANTLFVGALKTSDTALQWWSSGGVRRLSGFGIASTDTAAQIAAGTMVYFGMTGNRLRLSSIIFCAASIHALILTTQKATAGWLVIITIAAYAAPLLAFRMRGFQASALLKVLGATGLLGCILVPPTLSGLGMGGVLGVNAPTLDQRTMEVWPQVLPMVLKFPEFILGYGLGAIGQTSTLSNLVIVDNMFLFTALNVGVPLALLLFAIAGIALIKTQVRDGADFSALAIVALLCLNGITANIVVAGATGSIFLGYAIGCLLRPTRRRTASASRSAEA